MEDITFDMSSISPTLDDDSLQKVTSTTSLSTYIDTSIVIDPSGDILLGVYDERYKEKGIIAVYQVASTRLRISQDCLFTTLLDANERANPGKPFVEIGEKSLKALEQWLWILHGKNDPYRVKMSVVDIWDAVEVSTLHSLALVLTLWADVQLKLSRKYSIHVDMLCRWFSNWLSVMDPLYLKRCSFDALQELVYLCYELDHAEGFKIITRRLVYESRGHIKESNPSEHPHLCLPERVMSKPYYSQRRCMY
jgi:hypothetical protein